MWPEGQWPWSPSVLRVRTTGQPARIYVWGDSGNEILWQRARASLRYTDFCPITNSVVTGASTSLFSSTQSSAPLKCVKCRPSIGKSKCPSNAQDSFGPTHTTNNFSFSLISPVSSQQRTRECTELRTARSRCSCGGSPYPLHPPVLLMGPLLLCGSLFTMDTP